MRSMAALLLAGCSTLHAARPLDAGEHAVGVTVGGAMLDFGGAPVPLPNAVVEGIVGLPALADRPLDARAGLNVTGLPFGLVQGHLGAAWQLTEGGGWRPGLALSNRLFMAINLPGTPNRPEPQVQAWAADQLEVLASWPAGDHLVYGGVAQVFDIGAPGLLVCPAVGGEIHTGRGWSLRPELRWYGINRAPEATAFRWATGTGALGVSVGVARESRSR